jgi:predicted ribosomally synthesized peptide with SipW-like signal peptide
MKKVLYSLLVIGVLGSLLTGATMAVFTDQEVLAGNTVATGTLELTLNHSAGKPVSISNSYPGYETGWEYLDIYNTGSLPFEALMTMTQTAGDTTLYNAVTIKLKTSGWDSDCTNGDGGEKTIYNGLLSSFPSSTLVSSANFWHLANEGDGSGSPSDNIRAGYTERVCQKVGISSSAGNEIMGMSATFSETVDAVQDND